MELLLVENRLGIGQLRLVEDERELMRSEPMAMDSAQALARLIERELGMVCVRTWEGPQK